MAQLVAQLNPPAQRPTGKGATQLHIGVLWTHSSNQAHSAGEGVAPAHIDDVVINLAAGILRKLKQLKPVNDADLIVTGKQMAIATLSCDLVAIDQSIRGVVEMSIAESTRHGNRGDRAESLNRLEHRRVREPGNVSNRTELAAPEGMAAGPTTTCSSGAHPAAGKTQPSVATKANLEGTVGQIAEGVPQSDLSGSPACYRFETGGV